MPTEPRPGTGPEMPVLGYLIPEFPGQTHIIFWREIVRLREAGVVVHVASTKRPARPSRHAFRDEPCFYAWPPRGWLVGLPGPRALARQIGYALGLAEGGWRERLRALALLPSAWTLAAWSRRTGVGHLHVHSFATAAHLAALHRLGTGIRHSLVLHGDLPVYGLNHRAKLAHAAFACAVTEDLRRQIEAVLPGSTLDRLVPCGVDLDRFHYAPRQPGGPLRLISVGRLDRCKGIDIALEAIARIRAEVPVTYTLVGDGSDAEAIRDTAGRLGLDDSVTFLGSRGEAEIPALLHRHDVAVLTSHGLGEATATAIREAMATGMPVIMSDIGDARRMVEPHATGIIVPQRDPAAVAEAIRWFHANRAAIPAMGAEARLKAERDFSDRIGPAALIAAIRRRVAPTPDVTAIPAGDRLASDCLTDGRVAWRGP